MAACTKLIERLPPAGDDERANALIERAAAYGELGDDRARRDDIDRAARLAGAGPFALRERASEYLGRGEIVSALVDATELIRRNPRDAGALLIRADCYVRLGKRDEALQAYDAALRAGSLADEIFMRRAFLHLAYGEFDTAIADFNHAAQQSLFGDSLIDFGRATIFRAQGKIAYAEAAQRRALLQRAREFEGRNQPEMAIAAYSAVLKRYGEDTALLQKRGELLLTIGRPVQALTDFAVVVKRNAGNGQARVGGALALNAAGRQSQFLRVAQELIRNGIADDKISIALGAVYLARGDTEKAIEVYSAAIEKHDKAGDKAFVYNELRRARAKAYVEDGRFDGARRDIDVFLANDLPMVKDYSCPVAEDPKGSNEWAFPNDSTLLDYCVQGRDLRFLRGRADVGLHDWNAALTDFTEAIKAVPTATESFLWRGKVYEGRGEGTLALAGYDRALVLAADNADAWLGRGNILFRRKVGEEAEAAYSSALKLNPGLVDAWHQRGVLRAGKHLWGSAIADFTQGLRRTPKRPDLLKARGGAYLQDGQYRKAIGDLSAALAQGTANMDIYFNRGLAYAALGDTDRSLADFAEYSRRQGQAP